jgi:hypothetical protein
MKGVFIVSDTISSTNSLGLKIVSSGFAGAGTVTNAVALQWAGAAGKPMLKFIDSTTNLTIDNIGFKGGADIYIQLVRATNGAIYTHNNYIKRCVFYGATVANVLFGVKTTDAYSAGSDDFDGMNVEDCYFSAASFTGIGVLANLTGNSYHLRISRTTFASGLSQAILTKNVFNPSYRDVVVKSSDIVNNKYAIEALAGGYAMSFDNVYFETPLAIKTASWAGSNGIVAVLKNVNINTSDTNANPALEFSQYSLLINVVATTSGTAARTQKYANGFIAFPRSAVDTYTDTGAYGAGIDINGKLYEHGRSIAAGKWTDVAFNAGNFTASAGDWTVAAGDVATLSYTKVGNMMTVKFYIVTSTVSSTPAELRIAVPGSVTVSTGEAAVNPIRLLDNNTSAIGFAIVTAGATYIQIQRGDGGAFTSSTDQTYVQGQITFAID